MSLLTKHIQSSSIVFFVPSHHLLFDEATPEDKLLPAPSKEDLRSSKSANSLASNYGKQLGFNATAAPMSAPITINLLENASPMVKEDSNPSYAPTLTVTEPLSIPCVKLSLPLDVLGFLRSSLPLCEVATVLKKAIAAQLNYAADMISWKVQ